MTSKPTADVAMVGLASGPAAIAGLAFGYAYWRVADRISIGLAGGTLGLVSQNFGADEPDRVDLVLVQSVLVSVLLSVPLTALFWSFPYELVALVGSSPDAIEYGAIYLQVIALGLVFEFFNKVVSRAFAGVGDTFSPMVVRAGGAVVNIAINTVLIFGLDMGVLGAALGTLIATVLISIVFVWALVRSRLPWTATIPLRLRPGGPVWDGQLFGQLCRVSTPLMVRNGLISFVNFPLLAIAAVFGPVAVAAFEIGRRVRDLSGSVNWGLSIAASSLVGQRLGEGDEREAEDYARDILRLSLVIHLAFAVVLVVLASRIARLFVNDPATIAAAAPFVQIGALSLVALSVEEAMTGALRGAGDTRWPFYATLVGLYVFTVPIASLGIVTPLGVVALYLALLAETLVPAAITWYRFQTDRWKVISRGYRPSAAD